MIRVGVKRVQIGSHRSGKQDRFLRNDGNLGPYVVQSQFVDFHTVDDDIALVKSQPEQRADQRRFPRAGPADNSDLRTEGRGKKKK